MAGLDPAIHDWGRPRKTWMPGTRPGMTKLMDFDSPLPIDEALPALTAALRASNVAVLVAPPGAGKTTRVPLVLAEEPWAKGKILVLEPRRIAARAAADRMARTRG